jgi:hypothetical protein
MAQILDLAARQLLSADFARSASGIAAACSAVRFG